MDFTTIASTTPPANPPGCPPDHQYVPRTQRTPLIHTTHTSLGIGHPGANATLSLLRDRFWWPNMARDVRRFVQGCPNCAISKSSCHLPVGKILPLPIPNRPWSHLVVDFITDLPVSDGNTCISRWHSTEVVRFHSPPYTFFFSSLLASAVSSHLSIEETPSARLSKLENYGFDQLVSQRD